MSRFNWAIFALVVFVPFGYVSSCAYIAKTNSNGFDAIKVGDTEARVIELMGTPSVREKPDILFSRYATEKCPSPCVERFWYENRMALDIEAWSVELDISRRVVIKSHWASP